MKKILIYVIIVTLMSISISAQTGSTWADIGELGTPTWTQEGGMFVGYDLNGADAIYGLTRTAIIARQGDNFKHALFVENEDGNGIRVRSKRGEFAGSFGGNVIIEGNNGRFIFAPSFEANEDFLSIAPDGNSNWAFSKELRFLSTGELQKKVSNSEDKAFSIYSEGNQRLKIYGGGRLTTLPANADDITYNVFYNNKRRFQVSGNGHTQVLPMSGDDIAYSVFFAGKNQFQVNATGKIWAREVEVTLADFPDYVFENNYELPSLSELKTYIIKEGHLPNIPSAEEIDKNGIGLGDLSHKQMVKIEELTLYILQLHERIEQLETKKENINLERSILKGDAKTITTIELLEQLQDLTYRLNQMEKENQQLKAQFKN